MKLFTATILACLFFLGTSCEYFMSDGEIKAIDSMVKLYDSTEYEACVAVGERSVKKFPSNNWIWRMLGAGYLAMDKYDTALPCIKKALELNPKNSGALADYAIYLDAKEKYKDAVKYYEKSLAVEPDVYGVYSHFAYNAIKREDYYAATGLARKAISLKNNDVDKWNLIYALDKLGNSKAADSLSKVWDIDITESDSAF